MGLRVCSSGHAPLTVMPIYDKKITKTNNNTFFFKPKSCLYDDPFISCMIGLEKCCMMSAYPQWLFHSDERAVAHVSLVDKSYLPATQYWWGIIISGFYY